MSRERPASIALVDDDAGLRRVVEYQLAQEGFTVSSYGSGEEALAGLRASAPDLLLTDVLMPGMDGIELLDRARALAPEAVTLVITAHGDVATAVRAMQLGAVDFLFKPLSPVIVRAKVAGFVDLFEKARRIRELERREFERRFVGDFINTAGQSLTKKLAQAEGSRGTHIRHCTTRGELAADYADYAD